MVKVQKIDDGYMIEDKMFFSQSWIKSWFINLMSDIWESIKFWKETEFKIEYPWEYDKDNIFFKVYALNDGKLNYFIKVWEIKIALIQNPKALEKEEFDSVQQCLFTSENISRELDRIEFEGEKVFLWENTDNN